MSSTDLMKCVAGDGAARREKLLLAMFALALAPIQGLRPASGLVAHGPGATLGKVRLDAKLYRQAEQALDEVKRLHSRDESPRLTLNGHCPVCEFRQRCRRWIKDGDHSFTPRKASGPTEEKNWQAALAEIERFLDALPGTAHQ
jgi:hypothetical protein